MATIQEPIRFATFNASLNRNSEGELITDLSTQNNTQAQNVAEIIQRSNPDVVLINEFDFDSNGTAAQLFQENYLSKSQNGASPVDYSYRYVAAANTGIASGFDLDNNGTAVTNPDQPGYGNDAFGFGNFPGQFGMVLYSKYPIDTDNIRTFQNFLWKDMPGALLPDDPNTPTANDWYSPAELEALRLSSKSHWDVPINIDGKIIHALVSHPTPPVFDGDEDRNGKRNHDEIRFWSDYITPGQGNYIYDDSNKVGGLTPQASFVIMGDQNADPFDGDSTNNAILQLLDNKLINTSVTPTSAGGIQQAQLQGGVNDTHINNPEFDTADFAEPPGNLRVDYVLPSNNLEITDAAVFWPQSSDRLFNLVGTFDPTLPGGFPSSDHRLVWADVLAKSPTPQTRVVDIDFLGQATFPTGSVIEGTQLGGLSGITYDPSKGVYYSISDDRSQINPARFYTLDIDLDQGKLSNQSVKFTDVTTLLNANRQPFPESSLDPEAIRLTDNGTVFISSEGDVEASPQVNPFVNEFSLAGEQLRELPIPNKFLPTSGDRGIRNNLAFESVAITPNQKFLYTATENALAQDGAIATPENGSPSRILKYNLVTGKPEAEFLYETEPVAAPPIPADEFSTNGLVELLALDNSGTLLALERSFSVGVGNNIKLYEVRLQGATDISGFDSVDGLEVGKVAQKRLLLDFAELGVPLDNIEGITLGETLPDGRQSLVVVSDNNFSPTQFTQVLAFAIETRTTPDDSLNEVNGTSADDNLTGSFRSDRINGFKGDDIITGLLGNERLTGGGDNDTFVINRGDGIDSITDFGGIGTGSRPTLDAIAEVDTIKFQGNELIAKNMLLTQTESDVVISFENVDHTQVILNNFNLENLDNLKSTSTSVNQGNILFDEQNQIQDSFDVFNVDWQRQQIFNRDSVTFLNDLDNSTKGFSNSHDVINGQGGDDKLRGLSGDDLLRGGVGNDTLLGGKGSDRLWGGNDDDLLNGGNNNDTLQGGIGQDTLIGGKGSDLFVLNSSQGVDMMTDFKISQEDRIGLAGGLTFEQLAIAQGVGSNANNTFISVLGENIAIITELQASSLNSNYFIFA